MSSKPGVKTSDDQSQTGPDQSLEALAAAQEQARRAQADYQNLLRRTREERAAIMKLAAKDVVLSLLQPLHHLELAAQQLQDPGLNMVLQQFQQALADQGLEAVPALGQPFDPTTMEAVVGSEPAAADGDLVVTQVQSPGYRLNGEVIQHAKVVIGKDLHVKN